MIYFKCCKCKNVYVTSTKPDFKILCGSFQFFNDDGAPVGCGGLMEQITQENAEKIIEELR